MSLMIYGAYGYTGRLIVEEALKKKLQPVLAGRREAPLREMSEKHGLPFRVFELDHPRLDGTEVLLNCAGPFSKTAEPLWEACLDNKVSYLDITGEIDVLETLLASAKRAEAAGIVVLPGVGFDVVPSDCLAAFAARQLAGAERLELGFYGSGSVSRGTLKTMVETLPSGGRERRNGKLVPLPMFSEVRSVSTKRGRISMTPIPWGDVASAYYSTGIPNIRVFSAAPAGVRWLRVIQGPLRAGLRLPGLIPLAQRWIERTVDGPSEKVRSTARMHLWAKVTKGDRSLYAELEVPEGYRLTAETAVEAAARVLNGEVAPGAWTPSQAFSPDFILSFPQTSRSEAAESLSPPAFS